MALLWLVQAALALIQRILLALSSHIPIFIPLDFFVNRWKLTSQKNCGVYPADCNTWLNFDVFPSLFHTAYCTFLSFSSNLIRPLTTVVKLWLNKIFFVLDHVATIKTNSGFDDSDYWIAGVSRRCKVTCDRLDSDVSDILRQPHRAWVNKATQ